MDEWEEILKRFIEYQSDGINFRPAIPLRLRYISHRHEIRAKRNTRRRCNKMANKRKRSRKK